MRMTGFQRKRTFLCGLRTSIIGHNRSLALLRRQSFQIPDLHGHHSSYLFLIGSQPPAKRDISILASLSDIKGQHLLSERVEWSDHYEVQQPGRLRVKGSGCLASQSSIFGTDQAICKISRSILPGKKRLLNGGLVLHLDIGRIEQAG